MFPLILSIVLGVLLLLVLLLLVTELIATYPVWKQFEKFYSAQSAVLSPKNNGLGKREKVMLLFMVGVGAICIMAYFLPKQSTAEKESSQVKAETVTTDVPIKRLIAPSADSTIFFQLQTKWTDGKLYGNSTITFRADVVQRLINCRYYLLDKDGYLIKAVSFSPNDFLFSTAPDGKVHSLLNKFNTELSIDDYLKIEKLQVALDGKILYER